jgi:acetoin utilization deacetylase AcuC-like enzyme
MRIFSDPRVTRYRFPGHPEAPERVARSVEHLQKAGFAVEPPSVGATRDDALRVHTSTHVDALRNGLFSDADTPFFDEVEEIAFISLSGALSAARSAAGGEPAFSLMRPPGHHAGRERIAGFCYLNNLAAAVAGLVAGGRRVGVLDIDVHHGDGTEDIAQGREGWSFVSIHQSPLYPGTGLSSRGNCRNYPVPPGTGGAAYVPVVERALADLRAFGPDILAVSAGFDTFKECPIASLALDAPDYRRVGELIAATGWPRFAVLEGGYAPQLPVLIENFLRGFERNA